METEQLQRSAAESKIERYKERVRRAGGQVKESRREGVRVREQDKSGAHGGTKWEMKQLARRQGEKKIKKKELSTHFSFSSVRSLFFGFCSSSSSFYCNCKWDTGQVKRTATREREREKERARWWGKYRNIRGWEKVK